ncbi:MAG: choline TMA-lyase-activating enzyme [Filifactoraceae bacterium]
MSDKSPLNMERQALIFNKQKYNMYDGPGIRTIVFFKGCPLRCKWCANPEGLETGYSVMYKKDVCVNCGQCASVCPVGIHKMDGQSHLVDRSIKCIGCRKCQEVCIEKALSIIGERENISKLLDYVEEDRTFYEISGGGVTLGGGEVTAQVEAAENLLMICKRAGINTVIETCGYVKQESLFRIAKFTDTFLFDIKHIDPEQHFYWTGVRNERILENLQGLLEKRHNVRIRLPILKDVNDSEKAIQGVIEFLKPYKNYKNFKGIDILPYHKLGVNKYRQLDMEYQLHDAEPLKEDELKRIEGYFIKNGFSVTIMRH